MKAFTDLEQSKKLAEILPLESADMWFVNGIVVVRSTVEEPNSEEYNELFPCWSLAALLDIIPEGLIENYYVPNLQKENGKYSIAYGNDELLCIADNPIDVCYEMIIKLYEQKLL